VVSAEATESILIPPSSDGGDEMRGHLGGGGHVGHRERVAEAAGRRVPVRILTPESGAAQGVYLDIHGGGFYLGCAARGMLETVASPTPSGWPS
jgi:acetyl esterase/lipase